MNYRRFGRTGWKISEIGYGMWGLAGWTGSDDEESFASLRRAVETGCNFFDTAWAYGNGHSEKILAKLIQACPNQRLYIASKIPPKNLKWPSLGSYKLSDCYPADHVEEYLRKSLTNLGLSSIDLIQFHTWQDSWLDDMSSIRRLEALKQAGLIRAIGISINRWEPWNALRAVRSGLIDSVQVIYNIFDQNPEDELFPACKENDVAVIARVPFDEGSLTGALSSSSRWPDGDWRNGYFNAENLTATLARVEALKPLTPADSSLAQMALRFILSNAAISTTIPGMRKAEHVVSNLAASDQGVLPADLLKSLRGQRWDRKPTSWSQ